METVFEIAKKDKRNYITPEDVAASRASGCHDEALCRHVLMAISGSFGWGVEDIRLTAFVAVEEAQRLRDVGGAW